MSVQENTENIEESVHSASELSSKSDATATARKQLDPVDFLIVTRIPGKNYKFQWIIRQFSKLPNHKALHSTCIHVEPAKNYKLKLVKRDHGFSLFHDNGIREQSNEISTAKSQIQEHPLTTTSTFNFGGQNLAGAAVKNELTPQLLPVSTKATSTLNFGGQNLTGAAVKNELTPQLLPVSTKSTSTLNFGGQNLTGAKEVSRKLTTQLIVPPAQAPVGYKKPEKKYDFSDTFPIMLEYKVSVINSKRKELLNWSVSFPDDGGIFQSNQIGEIINNTMDIFPDDTFILDFNLKVISTPVSEDIPIASKPNLECNDYKKLSMDLKTLYENSQGTDVTLIAGTDQIRAHKLILSARSPIFRKIFHNDMKETGQNIVDITDVQFSVLQRLVEFLYTGVIDDGESKDMDLQKLYELYYAADKYEVMDLREMVGNEMFGRIQVENASEILIWADRHNDKDLKSRVMNFIRLDFEAVVNTDEWESCAQNHPRLAMEVVGFYVKKNQKQ